MSQQEGQGQGSGQSQGDGSKGTEQGQQTGTEQGQQTGKGGEEFDKDRAMATIQAQRESERAAIARAKTAEDELKTLREAQMSDGEKKDARLSEAEGKATALEREVAELRTLGALKDAAAEAGSTKPAAVARLADLSVVKHGADGSVTNAAEVVAKVKEGYPELFGGHVKGSADGGARGGANTTGSDMNRLIRERAGRA